MDKPTKYATADGTATLDRAERRLLIAGAMIQNMSDGEMDRILAIIPSLRPIPEPDWKQELAKKLVDSDGNFHSAVIPHYTLTRMIETMWVSTVRGHLAAAFAHVEQRTLVGVANDLDNEAAKYRNGHISDTLCEFAAALRERAADNCGNCASCLKGAIVGGLPATSTRMIVCPTCGNKRCPKASDHRNECTGSNEPGQSGSA